MNHTQNMPGIAVKNFFTELRSERFTGEIHFSCEECSKSVFMQGGEITHCKSNLLDDRLGDVIYRAGKISLDVFVELAGKVNSSARFGDLLIQLGVIDLVGLWDALNLQSKEILQSLVFYKVLECEVRDTPEVQTPDYGLRFQWDAALDDALEEQRYVFRFEKHARERPELILNSEFLKIASYDFMKDIVSSVEEHRDFKVIMDDHPPLSKNYTLRALFKLFSHSVISDTWGIFAQDLSASAETELMEAVELINQGFRSIEALGFERDELGWENAVSRANSILEQEFGPGTALLQARGVDLSQVRRVLFLQGPFQSRARKESLQRWPISAVALIHEGLQKALLYLLFEISNNKQLEDEARSIHAQLVK
ncbi:MAG: hypothetical protein RJB13_1573, partial [Pseudomonadota bacterium]